MRLNGRRIERAHQKVSCGDVLVVPLGPGVRVIEVVSLPARRGPASEAQGCYRLLDAYPVLDGGQDFPLAAPKANDAA